MERDWVAETKKPRHRKTENRDSKERGRGENSKMVRCGKCRNRETKGQIRGSNLETRDSN